MRLCGGDGEVVVDECRQNVRFAQHIGNMSGLTLAAMLSHATTIRGPLIGGLAAALAIGCVTLVIAPALEAAPACVTMQPGRYNPGREPIEGAAARRAGIEAAREASIERLERAAARCSPISCPRFAAWELQLAAKGYALVRADGLRALDLHHGDAGLAMARALFATDRDQRAVAIIARARRAGQLDLGAIAMRYAGPVLEAMTDRPAGQLAPCRLAPGERLPERQPVQGLRAPPSLV